MSEILSWSHARNKYGVLLLTFALYGCASSADVTPPATTTQVETAATTAPNVTVGLNETTRNNLLAALHRAKRHQYVENCSDDMPAESFDVGRLLTYHNFVRSEAGIQKLDAVPELELSAQLTADYLADQHDRGAVFAHPDTPEAGLTLANQILTQGSLRWKRISENLSISPSTNELGVMLCWVEHEGHSENVLDPTVNNVGFGVAVSKDGATFAVAHFANIE